MTCVKCGTMYPVSYNKCPKCKCTEAKLTQYKSKKQTQEVLNDSYGTMAIGGEISRGETDNQF